MRRMLCRDFRGQYRANLLHWLRRGKIRCWFRVGRLLRLCSRSIFGDDGCYRMRWLHRGGICGQWRIRLHFVFGRTLLKRHRDGNLLELPLGHVCGYRRLIRMHQLCSGILPSWDWSDWLPGMPERGCGGDLRARGMRGMSGGQIYCTHRRLGLLQLRQRPVRGQHGRNRMHRLRGRRFSGVHGCDGVRELRRWFLLDDHGRVFVVAVHELHRRELRFRPWLHGLHRLPRGLVPADGGGCGLDKLRGLRRRSVLGRRGRRVHRLLDRSIYSDVESVSLRVLRHGVVRHDRGERLHQLFRGNLPVEHRGSELRELRGRYVLAYDGRLGFRELREL